MTQSSKSLEHAVLQLGLVGSGVALWQGGSHLFEAGNFAASGFATALMLFSYVAGLGLMALATRRELPKHTAWLALAAALLTFADFATVHRANQAISGTPLTTDVHLFTDYASYLIRSGINPYEADLIESYRANRAPMNFSTPLITGDLTGRLAYPALHPLTYVPFQAIGFPTIWVYPILLVVAWIGVFVGVRPEYRPIALLPFLIDQRYMLYALGGVSDFGWTALLVWMIVYWKHPVTRAVLFGLAASYKHHPWLLAPFLLIRVAAELKGDNKAKAVAAAKFAAISTLTFGVINLPFFLWGPEAWLMGVTEPARAAMITWGQGLSALTSTGVLVIPKPIHGIALYGSLLLLIGFYATHGKRFRESLWLVPGVALFLGHRSLTSYWYFTVFPLVVALFGARRDDEWRLEIPGKTAVRAAMGLTAAAAGIGLVGLSFRPPPMDVSVYWVGVNGSMVSNITLEVSNNTDKSITPAFQVQSWSMQPLHWELLTGPKNLAPGDSAPYRIASTVPFQQFDLRRGAQVIVTDRGHYDPRVATRIEADLAPGRPDAVPNGGWRFWADNDVPAYWGVLQKPVDGDSTVELVTRGDEGALLLKLPPSSTEMVLDTFLLMPQDPIQIGVFVPEDANVLPEFEFQYGLQLWAGADPLRVLFGDEEGEGTLPTGERYIMLKAARGAWTEIALDIQALLTKSDLMTSPRRTKLPRFHHLDFPMVPVHVQLLVARTAELPGQAYFGAISQPNLDGSADYLYEQAIKHPEIGLRWRGEYNIANSNIEEGLELLGQAAELAPTDGALQFSLGDALIKSGQPGPAQLAFEQARDLGHLPAASEVGIGWAELSQGNYVASAMAFTRSLDRSPGISGDRAVRAEAHKGLAFAAASVQDCETASHHATLAGELDPKVWDPDDAVPCTE